MAVEQASGRGRPARRFALGLVAGSVYFGATVYWVSGVMATYGEFPSWVAVLIAALLASYLALYVGLFAMLVGDAVRRFGVSGVWFAPCFWVAGEWARSWVGGGFGWGMLGTSQATVLPVVQLVSVTGVYGLSGLVALVGTAAAAVALSRRAVHVRAAILVGALLGLIAIAGTFRIASRTLVTTGTVLRVGLVQGNIRQDAKWDTAFRDSILQRHLDLSRRVLGEGAGLVIWPESSTPFFFDAQADLAEPVRRLASQARTPFLIGTDEFERGEHGEPNRIYNAAVLVGADGRSHGSYRKMRLVPFGEYVPLKKLLFFVGPLVQAVSDFSPGTEAVVFDMGGPRLSVSICYESIYPEVSRAFVERGSELLATITNDAWFGTSSAAYQHFEQGAIRAVEEGRYIVRAANTGISGVVDPYGRVVARTRLFEAAALTVDVRLLDDRTIYSRIGDVVAWLSMAVTVIIWVAARWRSVGR